MHGGQSVPNFDYAMALGVAKTFRKCYFKSLAQALQFQKGLNKAEATQLAKTIQNEIGTDITMGTTDAFEAALKDVGALLGYVSQRPDKEIRKGPDNLWCGSNDHYLLFECKSEVSGTRQEITKHEAGQMNNHCAWFEDQYGPNANVDRFMIISTKTLSYEGDFTHKVKIIRPNKLKILKDQIKGFIKELKPFSLDEISDDTLHEFLTLHHLNVEDFSEQYSEEYYHKTR